MEKSAAQVLQLSCRCLAEAGTWKVLSGVGRLCLHRVTFCCAPCQAKSPRRVWLLSLGYWIAKILRCWWVCPGHGGVGLSQRWLGVRSQLRDWLLRAERSGALYSCVFRCSFISCVWLQVIWLSLFLEFAKTLQIWVFFFCRVPHWQVSKSHLLCVADSQALSNALTLGGKYVVSVCYT